MTGTLWETAERLRTVRHARQRFMTLWALEQASKLFEEQWSKRQEQSIDPDARFPGTQNWKVLYRGSVLDD